MPAPASSLRRHAPVALIVALLFSAPAPALAAGGGSSVSPWVAQAQHIGTADDSTIVDLVVFLNFRNQDALRALIKAQYTPGNPQYRQYLSADAFRSRFSPDAAAASRVRESLRRLGFTVADSQTSVSFVEASGTVAQVKAAFGVSQELYGYKGKVLRANAEAPQIPAEIADAVRYVAGLDESHRLRKPFNSHADKVAALAVTGRTVPDAAPPPNIYPPSPACSTYWGDHTVTLSTRAGSYPKTLPWQICGYTPQQLRQAYHADQVPQTGAGVRVGVVDIYASPTIEQDVNRYSSNHGLPALTSTNFQQIVPAGLYNVSANDQCGGGPQGWYEEETLDIEALHAMAPGATIIFGAEKCALPNTALYNMIENHLADIITNSYGQNGEDVPTDFIDTESQYFMQAAAEGISVLFGSGDSGDLIALNGTASGSWEATSPYVTAVGGTSLALLNDSGAKLEWGWGSYQVQLNDATVAADALTITTSGITPPYTFVFGSGGGPSLSQLQPDYQQKVVPSRLAKFTTDATGQKLYFEAAHRVTPDIAIVGDVFTGFLYGETYTPAGNAAADALCQPLTATTEYCEEEIGGTSLSSPLMAGVLALVDQARLSDGKPVLGFFNPALYGLPVGAAGTSDAPIIDVTKPAQPTAVAWGVAGDPSIALVASMNSGPNAAGNGAVEGDDTSYKTGPGYDEVTGLGIPNVPALIQALTQ
jgi:subtilase family serine protease